MQRVQDAPKDGPSLLCFVLTHGVREAQTGKVRLPYPIQPSIGEDLFTGTLFITISSQALPGAFKALTHLNLTRTL